ncbi:MAG: LuxR C-terminal-related transcriptional regulator [Pirellula sp.]|jgi:FixJ family two-component response regulator|nr:LuxR C-terminal-related transcriptional regulator [Pirellula sp.]
MTTGNVSVWVVSDDERLQCTLAYALSEAGLSCSKFTSSKHALDMMFVASPPCLVIDHELEGISGLDLVSQFQNQHGRFPFILITHHGTVDLAVEAMKRGALSVLEIPVNFEKLIAAVKSGLQIDEERRQRENQCNEFVNRYQALTAREREIAELVFEGKLSKQIAKILSISPKTVEVHRSRITKKLEVESVTQLVKLMQLTRT